MEILNFRTSEQIDQLFTAMNAAQKIMGGAKRDAENPHLRSKYADLASVWEAGRDPLAENGLMLIQVPSTNGGTAIVSTILGHKSGQWIAGELALTPDKATCQGMGSAFTYARRYALSAFLGIAPEDDDGDEATRSSKKTQEEVGERKVEEMKKRGKPEAVPTAGQSPTPDQLNKIASLQAEVGDKLYMETLAKHGYKSVSEIKDVAIGKAIFGELGLLRKMVVCASHGEIASDVGEKLFYSIPEQHLTTVFSELKRKLVASCGEVVALEEYERLRSNCDHQYEFWKALNNALEFYMKQQTVTA